jgi:hypothetical protein
VSQSLSVSDFQIIGITSKCKHFFFAFTNNHVFQLRHFRSARGINAGPNNSDVI